MICYRGDCRNIISFLKGREIDASNEMAVEDLQRHRVIYLKAALDVQDNLPSHHHSARIQNDFIC